MRDTAGALDLSDSEDEDEMMMDDDHGNGEGNGNGNGDEDDDLSQWTLDTFRSKPIGGDTAVNTVSWRPLVSRQSPADKQIRTMCSKMEEPLNKVDETLRLYGDVAAAIADCDEKHHVSFQDLLNRVRKLIM
jgi:hypothetical protein